MSDDAPPLVGDLELGPPVLNQRRRVHAEFVRDLTEGDMAAMSLNKGTKPRTLARIHASHHALARCIAAGMKRSQVSLITGYSPIRICHLEGDESFQALVADYRAEAKSITADLAERMSNVSLDAIEIIQERLLESPGEFSIPVLLDMIRAFADRTGHGPGSDVTVRVERDFVDRPPRETFDDWQARRTRELNPKEPAATIIEMEVPKTLN